MTKTIDAKYRPGRIRHEKNHKTFDAKYRPGRIRHKKNHKTIDAKYRPGRIRKFKNMKNNLRHLCKIQTRKNKKDNQIKKF